MAGPREEKLYIDGQWRDAADSATFDDIKPADETLIGRVADATAGDVSDAVGAARTAFDTTDFEGFLEFLQAKAISTPAGLSAA